MLGEAHALTPTKTGYSPASKKSRVHRRVALSQAARGQPNDDGDRIRLKYLHALDQCAALERQLQEVREQYETQRIADTRKLPLLEAQVAGLLVERRNAAEQLAAAQERARAADACAADARAAFDERMADSQAQQRAHASTLHGERAAHDAALRAANATTAALDVRCKDLTKEVASLKSRVRELDALMPQLQDKGWKAVWNRLRSIAASERLNPWTILKKLTKKEAIANKGEGGRPASDTAPAQHASGEPQVVQAQVGTYRTAAYTPVAILSRQLFKVLGKVAYANDPGAMYAALVRIYGKLQRSELPKLKFESVTSARRHDAATFLLYRELDVGEAACTPRTAAEHACTTVMCCSFSG